MLIFQGRVKTFGSSIVASYIRVSALRGVKRSTTCNCVAVKVSRAIEPGLVVEARRVHDECFAFPTTVRPAHPAIGRRVDVIGHIDRPDRARIFVQEHDVLGALDDLKRERHVGGPRHAGQIAFDLRIERQLVREIRAALLQSFGPIRNLTTFDHAETARHGTTRTELGAEPRRRGVRFDVPVGCVDGLPDAVEIGVAVGCAGSPDTTRLALRRAAQPRSSAQVSVAAKITRPINGFRIRLGSLREPSGCYVPEGSPQTSAVSTCNRSGERPSGSGLRSPS